MLPIHRGSVFSRSRGLLIAGLAWLACGGHGHASQTDVATRVEWRFDNLQRVGGRALTVVGQPTIVQTDRGPAIQFDGVDDGIEIDANPLSGRRRFTIEVVFQAAADGPAEQRFVHFEEPKTENRALIELRMTPEGRWALDTFLRSPEPGLALIDRSLTHSSGEWHTARLSYDGKTMVAFVDGARERSGEVPFTPLNGGRTSIGMRLNRVFWFKGIIHTVRILPEPTR
jgi:concanavalin A-like lectin/glucanase superfamily protein